MSLQDRLVRAWPFVLLLPFAAAGCHSEPSSRPDAAKVVAEEPADEAPDASDEPRLAGHWTGEYGVEWRAVVLPKGTRAGDVRRYAKRLHARFPLVFFDMYDDDEELPKLVAAHGNDDALPKAWRDAHAIGTIAGSVKPIDGGVAVGGFQLFEWRTLKTTPLP